MFRGHQRESVRLWAKLSVVRIVVAVIGAALPVLASPAAANAGPGWWNYGRPATYEPVKTSVKVPTRDGTPIACKLFRPGRNGVVAPGRSPSWCGTSPPTPR
jgi:hypothetical protein